MISLINQLRAANYSREWKIRIKILKILLILKQYRTLKNTKNFSSGLKGFYLNEQKCTFFYNVIYLKSIEYLLNALLTNYKMILLGN